MKVPHIKDMFEDGNPGFKPKFKPGLSTEEIGRGIVRCLLYVALIWFMYKMLWG